MERTIIYSTNNSLRIKFLSKIFILSFDKKRGVFQKPGTTDKVSTRMTNTSLRNGDSTKWRLDLDLVCLKTPNETLIVTKLMLYERFGTNFKLSSPFYCC